jgi:hypothetical protein
MRETSAVYDKDPEKELIKEEERTTKLLKGKVVKRIRRNRKEEVVINFEDGTSFFVDWCENRSELDLSITGNFEEDE